MTYNNLFNVYNDIYDDGEKMCTYENIPAHGKA